MTGQTRILGLSMALILLTNLGCARAYNANAGFTATAQEIAVISPADGVKIHALDSKVINIKPASAKDWNKYVRIRLRPGAYVLTLIPQGIETIKAFTRLTVRVEAGQRYRVRSQLYPGPEGRPGYYKFWMENEVTREVVSDIAESRNPFQPRK